jgi:2-amino-4-hydroxy-6-hydroxymethyldihydropteridine diphosphokinase
MSVVAYVAIGSNVGNARVNVARAIRALGDAGCVRRVSSFRHTRPWGRIAQPPFVNAIARMTTLLPPRDLLATLQRLERRLGRRATYRWGPRVADLDLLLYDDVCLNDPDLVLPHPRLAERAFLLELLREVRIPGGRAGSPRSRKSL